MISMAAVNKGTAEVLALVGQIQVAPAYSAVLIFTIPERCTKILYSASMYPRRHDTLVSREVA